MPPPLLPTAALPDGFVLWLAAMVGSIGRLVRRSLSTRARSAVAISEAGKAKGLKFFQFSFVDCFGVQRSKLVPSSRVAEIAEDGAGFAGFAAHLDMDPTMGDLLAVPDPDSLTVLPWQREVGWLSCNLVHNDSELGHGPRNVLRSVQKKLAANHGLQLKTGVECEFFLLDGAATANGMPTLSDPLDVQAKPCYDAHALMRRYDLISTLVEYMEELGWGPYQADHEDANGQFEINWDYDDALVTADRVVFFKYMARTLAEKAGCTRTRAPTRRVHPPLPLHQSRTLGPSSRLVHSPVYVHAQAVCQLDRIRQPRTHVLVGNGDGQVRERRWRARDARALEALAQLLVRPARTCPGSSRHLQPDGQLVQAPQRARDDLGRHLVANCGDLGRQQPHGPRAHPGRRDANGAPRGRHGCQPVPIGGSHRRLRP